jgi:hypothetical protein
MGPSPTTVSAEVPAGASTCVVPVAIANAVPVDVLHRVPAAVATHFFASQMDVGMVLPEMRAPVPLGIHLGEHRGYKDLDQLRRVMREIGVSPAAAAGEWRADPVQMPPGPMPCCCLPCCCVTSRWTVHPLHTSFTVSQFAMTGTLTAACLYVLPFPCFNGTMNGTIDEDGTSYTQTISYATGEDTFTATLTSIDEDTPSISYAITGTTAHGQVDGVQTINPQAGTNIIEYTSGLWAGMVVRSKKVTKK